VATSRRHHPGDPRLARGAPRQAITFPRYPGHRPSPRWRARGAKRHGHRRHLRRRGPTAHAETEEAINHAKAAALHSRRLNKIDVQRQPAKAEQQLYGLSVLPDNMGGDAPLRANLRRQGTGINELLDAINLVAELKDSRPTRTRPARGTCLEANSPTTKASSPPSSCRTARCATRLVLCGSAYGRIRALYDDLGRPIDEAAPASLPN